MGGFFGNPDAELITRWNQVATFYPFFRGHAHLDTKRREPWLFGEVGPFCLGPASECPQCNLAVSNTSFATQEATARIRTAIRARYILLPYIYTLFRHANTTGQPLMRPLWFDFPDVPATYAVEDEFLLGPALLVGARSPDTCLWSAALRSTFPKACLLLSPRRSPRSWSRQRRRALSSCQAQVPGMMPEPAPWSGRTRRAA